MNRRDFIKGLAAAGAAIPIIGGSNLALATEPVVVDKVIHYGHPLLEMFDPRLNKWLPLGSVEEWSIERDAIEIPSISDMYPHFEPGPSRTTIRGREFEQRLGDAFYEARCDQFRVCQPIGDRDLLVHSWKGFLERFEMFADKIGSGYEVVSPMQHSTCTMERSAQSGWMDDAI